MDEEIEENGAAARSMQKIRYEKRVLIKLNLFLQFVIN